MAEGKTLELIKFSKRYLRKGSNGGKTYVLGQPLKRSDRTPRDRSLNGKQRIAARKARNKAGW